MFYSIRTAVQVVACLSLSLPLAAQGISAVAGGSASISGPVFYSGPAAFKGQPYSMLATTTTVRTLEDGTHITRTTSERRYRDSEGRWRNEVIRDYDGDSRVEFVNISDPVAHVSIILQPQSKEAHITPWPEVKKLSPEEEARRAKAEKAALDKGSCPVDPGFGTEHLGEKEIAGLLAEGTRTTRVIPAGKQGNDREMKTTYEVWRSPDFDVDLERVDSNPEYGVSTMKVSEFTRGEPDAALFRAPENYNVTQDSPRPN